MTRQTGPKLYLSVSVVSGFQPVRPFWIWTIGGAISGWILAAFGFIANEVQSDESVLGIRLMISIFAAVGALVSIAIMYFYPLTETFMKEKVEGPLEEARAKYNETHI